MKKYQKNENLVKNENFKKYLAKSLQISNLVKGDMSKL